MVVLGTERTSLSARHPILIPERSFLGSKVPVTVVESVSVEVCVNISVPCRIISHSPSHGTNSERILYCSYTNNGGIHDRGCCRRCGWCHSCAGSDDDTVNWMKRQSQSLGGAWDRILSCAAKSSSTDLTRGPN